MKAFVYSKDNNKRICILDNVDSAKFDKTSKRISICSELYGTMEFDTKKCKITLFQN